jgi:hypothetical protein
MNINTIEGIARNSAREVIKQNIVYLNQTVAQTTNDNVPVTIARISLNDISVGYLNVFYAGAYHDGIILSGATGTIKLRFAINGSLSIGTPVYSDVETDSALSGIAFAFTADGSYLLIQITGLVSKVIDWTVTYLATISRTTQPILI